MASIYYNELNAKYTGEQAQANVIFIRDYLIAKGWSLNAICGCLGNFDVETGGSFNPNTYQDWEYRSDPIGNFGYGLPQWTPMLGRYYVNPNNGLDYSTPEGQRNYHGSNSPTFGRWCLDNGREKSEMETQLDFLNLGLGGYSTKWWANETGETVTWSEFITSNRSPNTLAKIFYRNYERSESGEFGTRPSKADDWYSWLTGDAPPPDTPDTPDQPDPPQPVFKASKMSLPVFLAATRRRYNVVR